MSRLQSEGEGKPSADSTPPGSWCGDVAVDGSHACRCAGGTAVTVVLLLLLAAATRFPLLPLFWFMNLDEKENASLAFPRNLVFPSRQSAGDKPRGDFVAMEITGLFLSAGQLLQSPCDIVFSHHSLKRQSPFDPSSDLIAY